MIHLFVAAHSMPQHATAQRSMAAAALALLCLENEGAESVLLELGACDRKFDQLLVFVWLTCAFLVVSFVQGDAVKLFEGKSLRSCMSHVSMCSCVCS